MDYETAARKYVELDKAIADKEAELKAQLAPMKQLMTDIENWFALRAAEEGLMDVRTPVGLVYWSTHHSAKVADPGLFMGSVIEKQAWDLLDVRANKTAVKSYIEGHGTPPPGVDFSSRKVFNLRVAKPKE